MYSPTIKYFIMFSDGRKSWHGDGVHHHLLFDRVARLQVGGDQVPRGGRHSKEERSFGRRRKS